MNVSNNSNNNGGVFGSYISGQNGQGQNGQNVNGQNNNNDDEGKRLAESLAQAKEENDRILNEIDEDIKTTKALADAKKWPVDLTKKLVQYKQQLREVFGGYCQSVQELFEAGYEDDAEDLSQRENKVQELTMDYHFRTKPALEQATAMAKSPLTR